MSTPRGIGGCVLLLLFFLATLGDKVSSIVVNSFECKPNSALELPGVYTASDLCGEGVLVTIASSISNEFVPDFNLTLYLSLVGPFFTKESASKGLVEILSTQSKTGLEVSEVTLPIQGTNSVPIKASGWAFVIAYAQELDSSLSDMDFARIKLPRSDSGFDIMIVKKNQTERFEVTGGIDVITSSNLALTLKNVGDVAMGPRTPLAVPVIAAFVAKSRYSLQYTDYSTLLEESKKKNAYYEITKVNWFEMSLFENKLGRRIDVGESIELTLEDVRMKDSPCLKAYPGRAYLKIFFDPLNDSGDRNRSNNVQIVRFFLNCAGSSTTQTIINAVPPDDALNDAKCEVTPSLENPNDAVILFRQYSVYIYKSQTKEFNKIKLSWNSDDNLHSRRATLLTNMANRLWSLDLCPSSDMLGSTKTEFLSKLSLVMTNITQGLMNIQTQAEGPNNALKGISAMSNLIKGIAQAYLDPTKENKKFLEYTTKLISLKMKIVMHRMMKMRKMMDSPNKTTSHNSSRIYFMGQDEFDHLKTRKRMQSSHSEYTEHAEKIINIPITFPFDLFFPSLPPFPLTIDNKLTIDSEESEGRKRSKRSIQGGEEKGRRMGSWQNDLLGMGVCKKEVDATMEFLGKLQSQLKKMSSGESLSGLGYIPPGTLQNIKIIMEKWDSIKEAYNMTQIIRKAIEGGGLDLLALKMKGRKLMKRMLLKFRPKSMAKILNGYKELMKEVKANLTEVWSADPSAMQTINFVFGVMEAVFVNMNEIASLISFNPREFQLLAADPNEMVDNKSLCQMGAAKWASALRTKIEENTDLTASIFGIAMDSHDEKMQKTVVYTKHQRGIYIGERSDILGRIFWKRIASCSCSKYSYGGRRKGKKRKISDRGETNDNSITGNEDEEEADPGQTPGVSKKKHKRGKKSKGKQGPQAARRQKPRTGGADNTPNVEGDTIDEYGEYDYLYDDEEYEFEEDEYGEDEFDDENGVDDDKDYGDEYDEDEYEYEEEEDEEIEDEEYEDEEYEDEEYEDEEYEDEEYEDEEDEEESINNDIDETTGLTRRRRGRRRNKGWRTRINESISEHHGHNITKGGLHVINGTFIDHHGQNRTRGRGGRGGRGGRRGGRGGGRRGRGGRGRGRG